MAPKINGFRSREQLKLRRPKSVSRNITPQYGGVVGHYGGNSPNPPPTSHEGCENIWRAWQRYHMDSLGWVDIAYSAGFCNHGIILAGRGYFTRTAANGTYFGNQNFYAFVWIGGGNSTPSREALDAFEWLINDARKNGNAGTRVLPHKAFVKTGCPGDTLAKVCYQWDQKPIQSPIVKKPVGTKFPLPRGHFYGVNDRTRYSHNGLQGGEDKRQVMRIQKAVNTTVDGIYGPKTAERVKRSQRAVGLSGNNVDGKVGPITWKLFKL